MTLANREKYLNALGVPDFLYFEAKQTPVADKISTQCLLVEDTQTNSFCQSGKTQDFLLKMLATIDLKANDVALINLFEGATLQDYKAKVILIMGSTTSVKGDFSTYHPAQILNNNTLKREVWEVLKQVQQCLK